MKRGRPRGTRADYPPHIDTDKLPDYCLWDKSGRGHWYTYTTVDGKRRRRRIAGPEATLAQLHEIMEQGQSPNCMAWLHQKFTSSPQFQRLSESQQTGYQYGFDMVSGHPTTTPGVTLGQMPLGAWRPGLVQKLVDSLAEKRGPSAAKKAKEYLSRVFNWAVQREYMDRNPLGKPELPRERKQQRLPDWDMLTELIAFARERGSQAKRKGSCAPYIWIALEICRKCRFRGIEAFTLADPQIVDAGIDSQRRKGSKDNLTRWDDALQEAVNAAMTHRRNVQKAIPIKAEDRVLIVGTEGQQLSQRTWQSAWARFMNLAIEEGIITREQWFGLHDMKRRGTTDAPGNKLEASGLSPKTLPVYDKSKPEVDPSR